MGEKEDLIDKLQQLIDDVKNSPDTIISIAVTKVKGDMLIPQLHMAETDFYGYARSYVERDLLLAITNVALRKHLDRYRHMSTSLDELREKMCQTCPEKDKCRDSACGFPRK
jgi:hypothetical protein